MTFQPHLKCLLADFLQNNLYIFYGVGNTSTTNLAMLIEIIVWLVRMDTHGKAKPAPVRDVDSCIEHLILPLVHIVTQGALEEVQARTVRHVRQAGAVVPRPRTCSEETHRNMD